jgi:hypothetical protein
MSEKKYTKVVKADRATTRSIQSEQMRAAREDLIGGRSVFKMDETGTTRIPGDWDIKTPLHDIIMAEFADENDAGEILRDGIWLKQEITNKLWRVARVIKCGPSCSDNVIPGALVMFPSDRGIPMVTFFGKKLIFLNEERIFAIVEKPKKPKK